MYKKMVSFGVFIVVMMGSLSAQQYVSLEEVLTKSQKNNLALKEKEINARVAKIDAQKMDGIFLPKINFAYTATRTNDPLNVFGTKLKQEIVQQSDFSPMLLNNPLAIENFNAMVKVEQPLFNLDGVFMRSANRAKANATRYEYERNKDYLTLQVKQIYAQLQILYEADEVLKKSKETVEANVQLVENMAEQGYAKLSDVLLVKVRMNEVENRALDNKLNIQNLSDQLYYLMGEETGDTLKPSEKIQGIEVDENSLSKTQFAMYRADLLAYQEGIEARRKMLQGYKSKFVPRINAFGQFEVNDSKFLEADAKNYMVGVQLSWSLFNGNKNRKDIQKSRAELRGTEVAYEDYLAKSRTEFSKAKRNIENAIAKISLAEKAVEQSKESYRIRTDRFKEGLEKTSDLLIDEAKLEAKELEYLQAVFQLKTAMYYLEFLTVEQ